MRKLILFMLFFSSIVANAQFVNKGLLYITANSTVTIKEPSFKNEGVIYNYGTLNIDTTSVNENTSFIDVKRKKYNDLVIKQFNNSIQNYYDLLTINYNSRICESNRRYFSIRK